MTFLLSTIYLKDHLEMNSYLFDLLPMSYLDLLLATNGFVNKSNYKDQPLYVLLAVGVHRNWFKKYAAVRAEIAKA